MKSIFSLSTLLTHCFLHLRQRWWWCSLPCHSPQAMWWSSLFLGPKSILQLFKCKGCLCEPSPQGRTRGKNISASHTFLKNGRYLSKVKQLTHTLPVCIFFGLLLTHAYFWHFPYLKQSSLHHVGHRPWCSRMGPLWDHVCSGKQHKGRVGCLLCMNGPELSLQPFQWTASAHFSIELKGTIKNTLKFV